MDQPNMQNFEFALRSDDSASAGKKKGVWPRTRIGDAASFRLDVRRHLYDCHDSPSVGSTVY